MPLPAGLLGQLHALPGVQPIVPKIHPSRQAGQEWMVPARLQRAAPILPAPTSPSQVHTHFSVGHSFWLTRCVYSMAPFLSSTCNSLLTPAADNRIR